MGSTTRTTLSFFGRRCGVMKLAQTAEDIKYFKKRAVEVLRKNDQYATAKATEHAFNVLLAVCKGVEVFEKEGAE